MTKLWTRHAVSSHLTLKCDLDLGSAIVLTHCTSSYDMVNICVQLHYIPATNEGVTDQTSCFITFDLSVTLTLDRTNGFGALPWQCTWIPSFKSFCLKMTKLCFRQTRCLTARYEWSHYKYVLIFDRCKKVCW